MRETTGCLHSVLCQPTFALATFEKERGSVAGLSLVTLRHLHSSVGHHSDAAGERTTSRQAAAQVLSLRHYNYFVFYPRASCSEKREPPRNQRGNAKGEHGARETLTNKKSQSSRLVLLFEVLSLAHESPLQSGGLKSHTFDQQCKSLARSKHSRVYVKGSWSGALCLSLTEAGLDSLSLFFAFVSGKTGSKIWFVVPPLPSYFPGKTFCDPSREPPPPNPPSGEPLPSSLCSVLGRDVAHDLQQQQVCG